MTFKEANDILYDRDALRLEVPREKYNEAWQAFGVKTRCIVCYYCEHHAICEMRKDKEEIVECNFFERDKRWQNYVR